MCTTYIPDERNPLNPWWDMEIVRAFVFLSWCACVRVCCGWVAFVCVRLMYIVYFVCAYTHAQQGAWGKAMQQNVADSWIHDCWYDFIKTHTHKKKSQKTENSKLQEFEVHRPLSKGTKLLFQVIKAIINQTKNNQVATHNCVMTAHEKFRKSDRCSNY